MTNAHPEQHFNASTDHGESILDIPSLAALFYYERQFWGSNKRGYKGEKDDLAALFDRQDLSIILQEKGVWFRYWNVFEQRHG